MSSQTQTQTQKQEQNKKIEEVADKLYTLYLVDSKEFNKKGAVIATLREWLGNDVDVKVKWDIVKGIATAKDIVHNDGLLEALKYFMGKYFERGVYDMIWLVATTGKFEGEKFNYGDTPLGKLKAIKEWVYEDISGDEETHYILLDSEEVDNVIVNVYLMFQTYFLDD